jgi:tetratricopeptide (TPR) repeat protein
MKRAPRRLLRALPFIFLAGLAGLALSCSREEARPVDASAESVNLSELFAHADQLYAQRESVERVREAVAVMRRARASDFGNYEAAWKLAKFDYYLGEREKEEKLRAEAFREGIAAGEAAVRIEANRPEGHFWLGANLGGRARLQGPLYALASVPDIRKEMETVIRLEEGFQAGSAYLALGQIDLELPEVLGGNRERAVENLEKGLRFGENNALLRLRLAEAYLNVKRAEDARRQLNAIFKLKPSPDYLPEYKEAQAAARALLEKRF